MSTPAVSQSQGATFGGLTASQWRQVAAAAQAGGDTVGANAARDAAARVSGSGGVQIQWIGAAAKAAIKAVLQWSRPLLPAKIRPYADNILGVLDDIAEATESVAITLMTQAGIPYDVAKDVAWWIKTFS